MIRRASCEWEKKIVAEARSRWKDVPGEARFAFGPNEGAFGHPGAGGSVGFADPQARLGFGYVANRMGSEIAIDPRPQALIEAVYRSRE